MANKVTIPFINPLQFYKQAPSVDARYNSRLFDNWYFSDTILAWEQKVNWHQPWQLVDLLHLQLFTNVGPVTLKLYNEDGTLRDTIPFDQLVPNFNEPDLYIYEVDVDMSGYEEGCYYFTIGFGSPVQLTLQSENIVLSEKIENTLHLEYSHPTFREDMIFETGIQPKMRIPGVLKYNNRITQDTSFIDQPLNATMIKSVSSRKWTLHLGGEFFGASGVPPYFFDKVSVILGCRTVLLDSTGYTKNQPDMDLIEVEGVAMVAGKIDLRPSLNRASTHYENNEPTGRKVAVMVNVDSKGFGMDTGGSETVIADVE